MIGALCCALTACSNDLNALYRKTKTLADAGAGNESAHEQATLGAGQARHLHALNARLRVSKMSPKPRSISANSRELPGTRWVEQKHRDSRLLSGKNVRCHLVRIHRS
jgi:hypothetical protein